jgi:phosphoglycerate dehydrogenase-like enzyme
MTQRCAVCVANFWTACVPNENRVGNLALMRIAVTSRSFSRHPVLRQELCDRHPGAEMAFNDTGKTLAGSDLLTFLGGHDAAIVSLEQIDGTVLDAVPELRVIAKFGVGCDNLDLAAMAARNVLLGWTGGVNKRSVAELVIAFAISLLRHVPEVAFALRDGRWGSGGGRQLTGRTVGLVGCGHVGKEVVRMLAPFDCQILAHDIRDMPDFYREQNIEAVTLEELLARADIVTLHVPLDDSTSNLMNTGRLALMREDAILINTARGGIVDETALKARLRAGQLAGAAFDVFATEPPQDLELLSLPNFLATPHIGGSAAEAILAMGRAAIDGLTQNAVPDPAGLPAG